MGIGYFRQSASTTPTLEQALNYSTSRGTRFTTRDKYFTVPATPTTYKIVWRATHPTLNFIWGIPPLFLGKSGEDITIDIYAVPEGVDIGAATEMVVFNGAGGGAAPYSKLYRGVTTTGNGTFTSQTWLPFAALGSQTSTNVDPIKEGMIKFPCSPTGIDYLLLCGNQDTTAARAQFTFTWMENEIPGL